MVQDEAGSIEILRQVPLLADLGEASLHRLSEQSWVRRYPAGQVLTSEGDPGDGLLIIEEGSVRVSRFAASGQEIVLALVEAPDAIGELALVDGASRSATVTAQSEVQVRVLPRGAFVDLLSADPKVTLAIMRVLAGMVRSTNERLSDILSLDVPGRVAKWLLARAATHGKQDDEALRVPFELSQGELATALGTTRVSINKSLRTFETLGAIELGSDEIAILNADLLREYTY